MCCPLGFCLLYEHRLWSVAPELHEPGLGSRYYLTVDGKWMHESDHYDPELDRRVLVPEVVAPSALKIVAEGAPDSSNVAAQIMGMPIARIEGKPIEPLSPDDETRMDRIASQASDFIHAWDTGEIPKEYLSLVACPERDDVGIDPSVIDLSLPF
jgi:hypothetical protein